jgi:hypothetical protein
MALTATTVPLQVAIGTGTPTAGDITQGGIALVKNAGGTALEDIVTSNDGTDILKLSDTFMSKSNALTTVRADGTATDDDYVTEKAVRTAVDAAGSPKVQTY